MNSVNMSENEEAALVLLSNIGSAVTVFVAASPIPIDWKAPLTALCGTITAAIFTYWKKKVNVPANN